MPIYQPEVINTEHWIPTGKFRLDKKSGKMKEVKRRVVHRRVFMTATGVAPVGLVTNIRIVRVSKHGEVTYSLSGRKEKPQQWWEKDRGFLVQVADKYTKIGKDSMTRLEAITFLTRHIDDVTIIMDTLDNGEPISGEEAMPALLRYGYPKYEYIEEKVAA